MTDADVRGYRLDMYRDPEDGSWVAEVPDLPGCVAGGQTAEEAVEMVADAIEAWVDAASASGRAIPLPRAVDEEYSGRFLLRVPRKLHARLAGAAREDGVSLNTYCATALAEAIGVAETRRAFVTTRFAAVTVDANVQMLFPSVVRAPDNAALYQARVALGMDLTKTRIGTIADPAVMQTTGKGMTQ